MKIALITDAWQPQVNGVVTTLVELVQQMENMGHQVGVIHPGLFKTRPCPGYPGIDLAIGPARSLRQMLEAMAPDAIHLATEGPLGWAARAYCVKHKLAFTTAFHSKFPEFVQAALKIPVGLGYALLRHFHKPSSGVMVPTQGVLRMLERRGFRNLRGWTHGVDMRLFRYHEQVFSHPSLSTLARPISLFVGRLSYEKNIQAFLQLDIPGSKVVCGSGPQEAALKERYPQVRWLGILRRDELAQVYAAADLFVFPSRTDTFGLVMLEAMACGTPVAAYPVDGPTEVVGQGNGIAKGGVLHEDLAQAWRQALALPRHEARSRALEFTWEHSTLLFLAHLVPARKPIPVEPRTQQLDCCHTTDIN